MAEWIQFVKLYDPGKTTQEGFRCDCRGATLLMWQKSCVFLISPDKLFTLLFAIYVQAYDADTYMCGVGVDGRTLSRPFLW
jgi:hypothetical protein